MLLLENATTTTGAETLVPAGPYAFAVWGTSIGQGTVTLQRKLTTPAGASSWLSVGADAALTAFGQIGVDLPAGIYRAAITDGGTDPVGLYASLERL